jgi:excisionase family DNA binding protein
MEGKAYYTVAEAAKLKGVGEEEILFRIRKGEIQIKRVGMQTKIPAGELSGGARPARDGRAEEPGKPETAERGRRYLEQVAPDLLKVFNDASAYGSCGIAVTFHKGEITRVSSQKDVTRVKEDYHE